GSEREDLLPPGDERRQLIDQWAWAVADTEEAGGQQRLQVSVSGRPIESQALGDECRRERAGVLVEQVEDHRRTLYRLDHAAVGFGGCDEGRRIVGACDRAGHELPP